MAWFRTFAAVALAAALAAAGGSFALADPPPWAHGHGHKDAAVRAEHGVLTGTITGVDYLSASILVATPRGVVPVAVTPTTSIFRGSGFASFSDLSRGAHVRIDFSAVDGRLVAQIIRIR
jgi:poly(3-hydroxybutyrate) depolymerase